MPPRSTPPSSDSNQPYTILLRPQKGSSNKPPEDLSEELKAWDQLHDRIKERVREYHQVRHLLELRSAIARATGTDDYWELLALSSTPADNHYPDLDELDYRIPKVFIH